MRSTVLGSVVGCITKRAESREPRAESREPTFPPAGRNGASRASCGACVSR